jgi:protein TonB
MKKQAGRLQWDHALALLLVLAVHGAVVYGLWNTRVIPHPSEAVTLFVSLVSPPPPQAKPQAAPSPAPTEQPKPTKPIKPSKPAKPAERIKPETAREPPHRHLAAEAPVVSPDEATEPLPPAAPGAAPPESRPPGPPALPSQPTGPVSLSSDLALVCPVRTPPPYPERSRRLAETGKVVLRVELDETGRVSTAQVITSSGHKRLDAAALAAVRTWRCQPAQRDGQAVRSVALQPFEFTLEGH